MLNPMPQQIIETLALVGIVAIVMAITAALLGLGRLGGYLIGLAERIKRLEDDAEERS